MIGYLRLELVRVLRDVTFLVFGIALPVVMYLLFSNLGLSPGDRHDAGLYVMVSMAAYGGMGAALNNGAGLAEDRTRGWLRQLRLTPLSPATIVTAKALTAVVVVVPAVTAVLAAGRLINGVELGAGQWAALVGLLWVGTLPFALLGLANGYLLSGQAAGLATVACSMGLAVVGGLWLPASVFPSWLAAIARWTPTANYADLSWYVAFGQIPEFRSVAVLLGWLIVFGLYARYAYRRGAHKV